MQEETPSSEAAFLNWWVRDPKCVKGLFWLGRSFVGSDLFITVDVIEGKLVVY